VRLAGRVALVTGTSPNIGGAIAEGMAAEGARVVCADRRRDNAADCAQAINQAGGEALSFECDVTNEAEVSAMIGSVGGQWGGIDILVNNAVRFNQKGLMEMPFEEWRQQLSVILDGAFLCSQQVARVMAERGRGGCIINIASTAAHQGQPGNIGYCTGKSAILNFTRAAAMDLVGYGIRVNSLTPTATDTGEAADRSAAWGRASSPAHPAAMEHFRRAIPGGRLPSPKHYAMAAVFLASDDAEMITGFDLRVDAGAVAKYWPWMPGLNEIRSEA
jgi:NAD(P)-dependent dehydrogenase (short-subunit alcohol dehydrogenase family)